MGLNLTPEQARFADLLAPYSRLSGYWDFEQRECREASLRSGLNAMSSGERQLAQFFLSLWTGQDEGFDMLEAASVLDDRERKMLIDWLADPFWP
ncbi:hypothetical protein [Serratia fonticola]